MNIKSKKLNYLLGAGIGVAVSLIMMMIFAFVMLIFKIDNAYSALFATVCVSAGAFASSAYTAKKSGSKGYLIGIAVGFLYFFLITAVSFAVYRKIGSTTAFHFVIILLSSCIGGILGVNKK